MKETKRNSIVLLVLTIVSAIITAGAFGESVLSVIIIGIIAVPLFFLIFSFLYGCFGVRTTFEEMLEKEEESKAKASTMAMERTMWEEEDGEDSHERHKALKRIKRLQRDYPDMWESLLDPDDEYLCHDYLYEKKQKKEEEESAGFAAVWTAMNANNSGNGNSSS